MPSRATTKSALFAVKKEEKGHKGRHWLFHEENIACSVVFQHLSDSSDAEQ